MLWLAAPVAATVLAAVWVWWRGWRARPRQLTTPEAMRAHRDYLDALVIPARGTERVPRAEPTDQALIGDG